MSRPPRTILHCDLDAFFASVEQLDDPSLRGRPVLVGGVGARGVVAAASYEAREFGCRSAMPTSTALRLCPHAVMVPGRGARYSELSRRFMAILEEASPLVQPLSLDEAFVDVTGSHRLLGDGITIATEIRRRTLEELGLVVSVGVAPNKFVAKIASDLEKPDALVSIGAEGLAQRLATLPIERMWGIGRKSADAFRTQGLRTFADLQKIDPEHLVMLFGESSRRFHQLAHGIDDRPVVSERISKSIGQERTFSEDISDREVLGDILLGEVEQVAERLRRTGARASRVTLKIRFGDFETITRSRTIDQPTESTRTLWELGRSIFEGWCHEGFQPVRLLGFSVAGLDRSGQVGLFEENGSDRDRAIDETTDAIIERFGSSAISRARAVRRGSNSASREK
ncbi:MAG: DNA polymerase IV [Phycisphaerae bacterium]|nr:DNA polymerase IV [Phycisphaerae bacterium]